MTCTCKTQVTMVQYWILIEEKIQRKSMKKLGRKRWRTGLTLAVQRKRTLGRSGLLHLHLYWIKHGCYPLMNHNNWEGVRSERTWGSGRFWSEVYKGGRHARRVLTCRCWVNFAISGTAMENVTHMPINWLSEPELLGMPGGKAK